MAVHSTAAMQPDRPTSSLQRPGIVRAMRVVLWLLALAVVAQPVFAGLFLDGHDAWRDWHATNGMIVLPLLALVQVVLAVLWWRPGHGPGWPAVASVGLLVAIQLQSLLGMNGLLAVHVPLGMGIPALVATLLVRTRSLTRPTTDPGRQR
jgi:cytochrome bd-type quinol oxidase subunit 2